MTDDLIPSAENARARALDAAGTQTILWVAIAEALLEEIDDGLFTVTYDVTGKSSGDVQWAIEHLRQLGYTATLSVLNLVISW